MRHPAKLSNILALIKDEIKAEERDVREMVHQEQQFNQTMKILPENRTRFTDIISGALQMMHLVFQQQRNNVMFPPRNNYPSNDVGLSQWTRQQNYQYAEQDRQGRNVEKHYTE